MVDMYLELSIILLSVIAVLSVLIVYIVRQTLTLKREFELQVQKKSNEDKLWIDRHESESNILGLSDKLEKANLQVDEETNLEQMVTFTKRSSESFGHVTENGHHEHVHVHHHPHVHSSAEHFYENTTSDANEYSEYCVPNCEPEIS